MTSGSSTVTGPAVTPRARVLVVEDEPDQRQLLTTYLQRAGCVVQAVESGEDAMVLIDAGPTDSADGWDLAVVDLRLPGMSGGEVAERLRRQQPRCRIALTSVLDPQDYPESDLILPKPFTRAQVVGLIPGPGPAVR